MKLLLQYRAAAFAGISTQFFWGLIRMMIFQAFYENASADAPMRIDQVVVYVWLGQALLMLIPFRPDEELAGMIRTGQVATELLRPVNLYAFWFSRAVAGRLAPTLLRAGPLLVVATLMGWLQWPAPVALAGFALLVLFALLVSSALWLIMTITSFWTLVADGLSGVTAIAMFLLSGMIVPLPLFPDWMQPLFNILPFRALCDVPFRVFTGDLPPSAVPVLVLQQAAWLAGLVLAGGGLLRLGTRRLEVQGG